MNLPQRNHRVFTLSTINGNAKVVVFSGRPLNQPVFWKGPLALASQETLDNAVASYQRGDFGILEPQ